MYARKGYRQYQTGEFNINICGIRSHSSESNKFDDAIVVFYRVNGTWTSKVFPATTDPGKPWLLKPMDPNGTLMLVPGQYIGAFRIGIHGRTWASGGYEALEQIGAMMYVRDNNLDAVLDFDLYRDPNLLARHGFYSNPKSNIHRAAKLAVARWVETYSAGCQVIQDPGDFDVFMRLCKLSATKYGNSFTYTLLEEMDLEF